MSSDYNNRVDDLLKFKKHELADMIIYLERVNAKLDKEINRLKGRYEGVIGAGGTKNPLVK